jgi:hypothetical protein
MFIRQLSGAFDPVYLKPKVLAGAIKHLLPATLALTPSRSLPTRSEQERRQGDRRRRKQKVLLELRNPYSRRNTFARRMQDAAKDTTNCGIDLYA